MIVNPTLKSGRLRLDLVDLFAVLTAEGFTFEKPENLDSRVDLGHCPFDRFKRPSLRGNLRTWKLWCTACSWYGNIIDFVQKRHGLDYVGACKHINAWEDFGGNGSKIGLRKGGIQ